MDETPKDELAEEVLQPTDEVEVVELAEEVLPEPKKEVVTETRSCEECQGDGKWDGVLCGKCHGSGKIFKDGTVVLAAGGQTFVASKGVLEV